MGWGIQGHINNVPYSVSSIVDLAKSDAGSQKGLATPGAAGHKCNLSLVVQTRIIDCHFHGTVYVILGHFRDDVWNFLELVKATMKSHIVVGKSRARLQFRRRSQR